MISLSADCLLFKMSSGEYIPCSAEHVSIELLGDSLNELDPELIRHAAAAVLHYFKHELQKNTVSVGEFSLALERVLSGFGFTVKAECGDPTAPDNLEASTEIDLGELAAASGCDCELIFFPKLRDEMRSQLEVSPRIVRFRGLRTCVKKLTGSRRWNTRCRDLEHQIVDYMRGCLSTHCPGDRCALLVQ